MTRVNLVSPTELTDQHLIAEYRELRLLTANMKRIFGSKTPFNRSRIPTQFTLNAGHVIFFADKGKYIARRYQSLIAEMRTRGFQPQYEQLDLTAWPSNYFSDWEPRNSDMDVVRERIKLRISQRPGWYRYYGKTYGVER